MNNLKIYIKYKQSSQCKAIVHTALDKLGLPYRIMGFGTAEIKVHFTPVQLKQLKIILSGLGLELIEGKKTILIEKIKNAIVETVERAGDSLKVDFSCYLAEQLNYDYTYLASLFSESTGHTIEYYIMARKIDRAKELLLHSGLNLTDIASKLNYSSVGHLSNQFKKVTGVTPTLFRQLKYN